MTTFDLPKALNAYIEITLVGGGQDINSVGLSNIGDGGQHVPPVPSPGCYTLIMNTTSYNQNTLWKMCGRNYLGWQITYHHVPLFLALVSLPPDLDS